MYYFVIAVIVLTGLIQIPIIVDFIRAVCPQCKIRRTTHRCINFLLISVMSSFFIIALSYYLLLFLPLTIEYPFSSIRGLLHIAFAIWIWTNVVLNYFLAVLVHPGRVPSISDKASVLQITNGMLWKPVHCHYCSVCQESIAYMDHHCPFTGNCAGLNNYSYFLLCLMYSALGLGYALWMSFSYFNQCILSNVWWIMGIGDINHSDMCTKLGPHVNIVVAVIGGFYVTVNMSIIQVLLLLSDLSSYDILKNVSKISVFRLAWHRIRGGKYKEPGSRLNVMLLQQRTHLLWFLIPCRNTNSHTPISVLTEQ